MTAEETPPAPPPWFPAGQTLMRREQPAMGEDHFARLLLSLGFAMGALQLADMRARLVRALHESIPPDHIARLRDTLTEILREVE